MKFLIVILQINSKVYTSLNKPGQISLTFDDGPSPYTGPLLTTLKERNVEAAFHITGEYLKTPFVAAYARQAKEEGHLVGLNSKINLDKVKVDDDSYFNGLVELQDQIQELIGEKPIYLRVPYSTSYPGDVVDKLEEMGFIITSHNLDSKDYLVKGANDKDTVFRLVKEQLDEIVPPAKGSFILVMHDSVPASANQIGDIIDYIKEREYDIVRLDDGIGKREVKVKGTVKGDAKSKGFKVDIGLLIYFIL